MEKRFYGKHAELYSDTGWMPADTGELGRFTESVTGVDPSMLLIRICGYTLEDDPDGLCVEVSFCDRRRFS